MREIENGDRKINERTSEFLAETGTDLVIWP